MKTGQSIEIATGTDLELVKGHVARVAEGEIVVDLDRPRGTFAPETPLALYYDDPVGHHQLAARVIRMQGPGRLILWPATEPERPAELKAPGDARARIRVEHLLRMEYEVIAREEVPRVREEVLHGARILKYERPSRRELLQAAGAEHDLLGEDLADSPLWAAIQRIEQKLNLVLERLGAEPPASDERPLCNLSLSARGLRFRDFERRCHAGDLVLLTIELPMNPTIEISAIAETLYVVEDIRHPQLSVGQDVVLEFRVIQEEAQEHIERYCRMVQGAQRAR
jgi:hypothetical protein